MIVDTLSYKDLLLKIEKFYDKVGPKYELIYPNFKVNNIEIAKSILKNISLHKNARIADLGCGPGWLLNELAELNPDFQLFGFDISKESIEFANSHFKSIHPQINFKVSDWLKVKEMISEKFDLVICVGNSLTHFPEEMQKDILMKFSNLLNDTGTLLIDTYKNWNGKMNGEIIFEPKGLTRNEEKEIFSCFFSEYQKDIAIRNVCFAHYSKKEENPVKPFDWEQYITYQFKFAITPDLSPNKIGFNNISEIGINDEIGIFNYFKLT